MSFTRAKSTGWTAGIDKITASQINQIDVNQSRAVDGTGGGVYQPSAVIEIQGTAGLKINGSSSAARVQYGSRSLTRTQDGILINLNTGATYTPAAIGVGQQGAQLLERMPNGATLTAVTAYHNSGSATPPATPVQITVSKTDITTGTTSAIGATTPDPTAGASYGAHHGWSVSGLSEVIDRTKYVYKVIFDGEAGGGSSSTDWYGCTCTLTVTDQDEAP